MGREMLEKIHTQLDFLEAFNARVTYASDNDLAWDLAGRWGLPASAGSDAHAPSEVGRTYVEMAPFDDPNAFLGSLGKGQIRGRLSSPLVHFYSAYAKWRKRAGALKR
jgi:hypothetical protein